MNKTGIIYKVSSPDGKVYIGKSTTSLEKRMKWHLRECFKINKQTMTYYLQSKFYIELRKYGYSYFKWEVIAENVPIEKLNEEEEKYIYLYNSKEEGYNSTIGG